MTLEGNYYDEQTPGAGASISYDFITDQVTAKFQPFRNIVILNSGTAKLKVYINDGKVAYPVAPGTIMNKKGQQIHALKILNAGLVAGEYTLSADNEMSEIDYLRILATK